MLNAGQLKVAIVMINRAPLKGDEARNVVNTLDALEANFKVLTAPPVPVERETVEE